MFGFLDGSDIGAQGEQSIELETTGSYGHRRGHFTAIEQEIEYESVPTQFFAYELSAHGMLHSVSGVEGVANNHSASFSGLSGKFSYLILGRGPESPIGLTVSAEPEWARIDDVDGTRTADFSTEFRIAADTELIANRLYAAVNIAYEPGVAKGVHDATWEHSSGLTLGTGLAYRITPTVTVGGAVEYDRAYDGLTFQTFDGHALYVGPTLMINFTPKILLAAAFSAQVWGHAVGDSRALDLTNFERYRSNLKLEFEF